ncbi:hypothetical protein DFH07DRAFT_848247 [Mycena maculata]|uniref:Uncharacterized protein n=1 Tax=Mycena maculata TaxID=230809 RepID=A0AAD7HZM4_9AGAR|nr:hypothetical protein DFH07DRAFT_848247 [Mycena maculata]
MEPSLSVFELVCENLRSIGALTIEEFLSAGPEELAKPDAAHDSPHNIAPSPASVPSGSASSKNTPPPTTVTADTTQNVARLHHTAQRAFGQSNGLKFEFLEEAVDKKQCILTITRPDGSVRSYKSNPTFRRKNDAKAQVATIAIEHGALDFIIRGDSDALKAKKGVLLAPLGEKDKDKQQPVASTSNISSNTRSGKRFVPEAGTPMPRYDEIAACCRKWRGTLVYPSWLDFDTCNKHGAVLKIQLAPHCYRVYSCDPTFDSPSTAREHCAEIAVTEGVLEFIRHGNGQTAPQSDLTKPSLPHARQIGSARSLQRALQLFYEELPRPFEEPFGDKTASEINAPGWLSNILASAKGARFTSEFYSFVTTSDISPRLMYGCLLRLKRPGECRSYLAEPQFASQKDAKAAVSLLALSQGAGKYIREVGAVVEARIMRETRNFVASSVFPCLTSETQRLGGPAPKFESYTADDAFGCTLLVALKPNAAESERRQYTVPAEYRSKADAKVAVAYLAAEQGVFDFLRFAGQPLPPGHAPSFSVQDSVPRIAQKGKGKKRKNREQGPPAKKVKMEPDAGDLPTRPFPSTSRFAVLPPRPEGGMASGSTKPISASSAPAIRPTGWRTIQAPRKSTGDVDAFPSPSSSLEDGELPRDDLH